MSRPAPNRDTTAGRTNKSKEVCVWGGEQRKATLGAEYVEKNLAAADDFTGPFQEAMTARCWGVAGGTMSSMPRRAL